MSSDSKFRLSRTLAAVVGLGLVLAGCSDSSPESSGGPSSDGEPQTGGTLTVGLNGEPTTLDPQGAGGFGDAAGAVVGLAILEPLMFLSKDGELTPGLAESVDTSEDATSFTVNLRPDLQFSDGSPLDAEAVISSYERLIATVGSVVPAQLVNDPPTMEASDDSTVVFTFTQPWAEFPKVALVQGPGSITSTTVFDDMGASEFSRAPVGAGAFQVAAYTPGTGVEVERNPNYWQQDKPYLDGISFRFLADQQSRLDSLTSGSVDIIQGTDSSQVAQAEQAGLETRVNAATGVIGLYLQQQNAPMDDANVRRALSMAIDREAISEVIYSGLATPAFTLVPEDNPAMDGVPVLQYDLDEARSLIEDYGRPVEFRLTVTPQFSEFAQLLQQMWEEIGVTAEIDQQDDATANDAVYTRFEYQAFLTNGHLDPNPLGQLSTTYLSGPANWIGLNDPAIDEALQAADSAPADEQTAAYQEALTLLEENTPIIPVVRKFGFQAWNPEVRGADEALLISVQAFRPADLWLAP